MRRINSLAIATTLLPNAETAMAEDFDKGLAAYNSKDYTTALQEFRPLAERGNVNAQAKVGVIYDYGQGVLQDYAKAVRWYRMAAVQGDASTQTLDSDLDLALAHRIVKIQC